MRFWFVLDFCLWWQQRWCLQPRGARGCGGELSCLGGAWGYITDPSGMLQLGARFYWPEVGRFVQQDPARAELNSYAYASGNPVSAIDPTGLKCYRGTLSNCRLNKKESSGLLKSKCPKKIDYTFHVDTCPDEKTKNCKKVTSKWRISVKQPGAKCVYDCKFEGEECDTAPTTCPVDLPANGG